MNPMPELNPQLKQLRLSGILESLEARNRQAIEAKMSYTEFLALLISDEIARRDQKKFTLRLRRAAFRAEKTLEQFDFDRQPGLNRALIQDLAAGSYIREKVPVLIAGQVGTGKSHLAQALGHCAVRQGHDVVFTSQTQLLTQMHAARAVGTFERRFQALARVAVLIVDDFALKPLRSHWVSLSAIFFRLLDSTLLLGGERIVLRVNSGRRRRFLRKGARHNRREHTALRFS
jgi:DNA replication protein DnaC